MKASSISLLILFTHGEALQLTTVSGNPDWATGLAGGTLTSYTDICVEGSPYHYTKDWDCGGNDIAAYGSPIVGGSGWIDQFKYCAAQCDALSNCVAFNYPNPGNGNCWIKFSYQNIPSAGLNCGGSSSSWEYFTKTGTGTCSSATPDPTPAPTPSPTPAPTPSVSATGDPHLQNVHGQRFDLMKPGKHILINIPRGESAADAMLRVEAQASRVGVGCSDMYFQALNITGSWAEQQQAGGYHYSISEPAVEHPEWIAFYTVELKVVSGRTQHGIEYLNFYVKHLGRAGFAVGGLLGEDDHTDASTVPASCHNRVALVDGDLPTMESEDQNPSMMSSAEATYL